MQETAGKAIPAGYKQTEVGVIPEDWKVKSGEEITVLIGKGASPRWQGFSYTSDGMLFVTSENVRDGYLDISEPKYLPLEFHEKLKRSQLQIGDILINLVGASIGRSCYIDIELGEANINQAVSVFRLSDEYNARFISCYFSSSICIGRILDMQVDAARPNISLGDLRRFLIPLPPSAEQTAIANVLSDSDAVIDALEQLIAKKQAIKTATMQQLLTGRTRLPAFAQRPDGTPKGYKSSELGQIPEDWKVVCLGDIGQSLIGLTYSPKDVSDDGVLVLRSSNVQNGRLAYEDTVFVQMDLPDRVMVKEGDILICVRNGSRQLIGKCALIDKSAQGFAFGAFMSVYRTEAHGFVFYQFQSDIIQSQINETMGATINQITNRDMARFKIMMPKSIEEQTAIATILTDMDSELTALEQKLAKARDVKLGMMQQLLTGRIRLPLEVQA
ncbi:MAG: restriction endonuclease subunit S [Aeromonadaceae bacterium]